MVSDFSFYFMNKKKNKTEKDRAKKEKKTLEAIPTSYLCLSWQGLVMFFFTFAITSFESAL